MQRIPRILLWSGLGLTLLGVAGCGVGFMNLIDIASQTEPSEPFPGPPALLLAGMYLFMGGLVMAAVGALFKAALWFDRRDQER